MSEIPKTQPFSRPVRLEDFFDEDFDKNTQNMKNKYNKNHSYNESDTIAKHQQEFGHKKRIKP